MARNKNLIYILTTNGEIVGAFSSFEKAQQTKRKFMEEYIYDKLFNQIGFYEGVDPTEVTEPELKTSRYYPLFLTHFYLKKCTHEEESCDCGPDEIQLKPESKEKIEDIFEFFAENISGDWDDDNDDDFYCIEEHKIQ